MLDTQFRKITGASSLQWYNYWASTEFEYDQAWYVYFGTGYVNGSYKYHYSYWVRAVLAF